MGYDIKGTVHHVGAMKAISEKFKKRDLVIKTSDNPKYPQLVLLEMSGDKATQLDDIGHGDEVRIEFSIRGREWRSASGETKYFTSLDVWKVDVTKKNPTPVASDAEKLPF